MNSIVWNHKAQYYETDQMGIIHHSNYIRWFEEARTFFLEEIGYPYNRMEQEGIIVPVLDISCKYHSMVHFADTVSISVSIEAFNGIRLSLSYQIHDTASGELRTTGTSSHCFLNSHGKPVSLKKSFPQLYRILSEAFSSQK